MKSPTIARSLNNQCKVAVFIAFDTFELSVFELPCANVHKLESWGSDVDTLCFMFALSVSLLCSSFHRRSWPIHMVILFAVTSAGLCHCPKLKVPPGAKMLSSIDANDTLPKDPIASGSSNAITWQTRRVSSTSIDLKTQNYSQPRADVSSWGLGSFMDFCDSNHEITRMQQEEKQWHQRSQIDLMRIKKHQTFQFSCFNDRVLTCWIMFHTWRVNNCPLWVCTNCCQRHAK